MSQSLKKITKDNFPQWYLHKLGTMQLSSEDLEKNFTAFRNVFHSSAVDTLGQKFRKHQDCFDENGEEVTAYTGHIKMILA